MIYCMSDLHGEKDLFDKMLKQIQFSSLDHLYILGDVIDRGPHGVELLEQIMASDPAFSRRVAGSSGYHGEWTEIPPGPWLSRIGSGNPHLGPGG